MLLSSEEMGKTLREITKDDKESAVDQINEINRTARKVKEKRIVAEAIEDEICDPRTVAYSKNCYKRSIEAMNRPGKIMSN